MIRKLLLKCLPYLRRLYRHYGIVLFAVSGGHPESAAQTIPSASPDGGQPSSPGGGKAPAPLRDNVTPSDPPGAHASHHRPQMMKGHVPGAHVWIFALLVGALLPLAAHAQGGQGGSQSLGPRTSNAAPTGGCGDQELHVNNTAGDLYDCKLGVWFKVNGGGGGSGCTPGGTANNLLYDDGLGGCTDLGSLGTTSTLLHGNAAGLPTFGSVVSADLNLTPTTCTNQFLNAISAAAGGTCGTVTSAYVDNSIALTGVDINTSNQVTATHLAAALPVDQGGTGTGSTLTGLMRGSASVMTAAELSGDVTTSGSNVATVVNVNGIAYSATAAAHSVEVITSANTTATAKAIPDCTDSGGNHINYTQSTDAFSCGTSDLHAGTVTGCSFTGGLISCSGSTTTASTVAGTSGGIPYFSGSTTWASSALLTQYGVLYGGGSGSAPVATAADTTTTHALFATATSPAFRAIAAGDVPTLNQNTTGSAAKWTTARNLAGNSVDGSANVTFANAFIVQGTADAGLTGAQFLGALGTGPLKNTTTTGVLSVAVAADIYGLWSGSCSSSTFLRGDGACAAASGGTGCVPPGTTANALLYDGALGTCLDSPDFTIATDTLTAGASGLVDFSAITSTSGFKVPSHTTNTAGAAAVVDYDSTKGTMHAFTGGADSLLLGIAAAPTGSLCAQTSGTAGVIAEVTTPCTLNTLANLGTTNINSAFLFQTSLDIGSTTKPARNLYLYGGATYGTGYTEITPGGLTTATYTATLPAASDTLVEESASDTTVTDVLHATGTTGVGTFSAIATGDLPTVTIAKGGTNTTSAPSAGAMPYTSSTTASSWSVTPTLGLSGTAGTLAMYPTSGNFTTTWGSAATASNTILGFPTAPTTLDLIECTTASTTCTLTDAGILTANVVTAASNGTTKQICTVAASNKACSWIDFPDVKIIPAANCNNTTAGAGWTVNSTFVAACGAALTTAHTNNLNGVLQGTPSVGTAVGYFDFELPGDWDTGVKPYIAIYYGSGENTTNTVIWTISTACAKQDGSVTDDPSWIAESAMGTQTMTTKNRMWAQSAELAGAMTNCIAGSSMFVKVALSGTATASVNVSKAVITIPRLLTVQAN